MVRDSSSVRSGSSDDASIGQFVVVVVKLSTEDPQDMAETRQQAMKEIGKFLGARVATRTSMGSSETTDSGGRSIASRFFSDYSEVRVDQTLGAVEMLGIVKFQGRDAVAFTLTEGAAKRMQSLSEKAAESLRNREAGKPLEVEAVGFARMAGGDLAPARSRALLQAQRFAIEAALGATIVGLSVRDADDRSKTFRDTCVSNSDGQIARFDVLEEGAEGDNYRVRIRAVVQQGKLLDSYRAHLRAMGDPRIRVDASGETGLRQMATDFFREKGFRVSDGHDVDWVVILSPSVTDYADPADGARRTKRCQIGVQVKDLRSGEILLSLAPDRMKNICDIDGDASTQTRVATERAFKSGRAELHKRIAESIKRLGDEGRPVRVAVSGLDKSPEKVTKLVERLQQRPGLNDVKGSGSGGRIVLDLKSIVATDLVATIVAGDACAMSPGSRSEVTVAHDGSVVIEVLPASPSQGASP